MSRVKLHDLYPPFIVQFLLGTPLCVVQFQHNLGVLQYVRTCPKCSVASTTFSHVCHSPTHPFVGLLVLAACSLLSHSTTANTHVQELQIPRINLQDVSHNVSLMCLMASTARIHRCGQACRQNLLASTSCSIWLHPLNNFAPSTLLQRAQLLQSSPLPRIER